MAELIAPTTAAATSADFNLAAGTSRTLNLKTLGAGVANFGQFANANVEIKTASGYVVFGALTNTNPVMVLTAVGDFRISKDPTSVAVGVDGS